MTTTQREVRMDEEQRFQARSDANTFRIHQQFRQAHGRPIGELTTLVTSLIEGGVFVSGQQRRK